MTLGENEVPIVTHSPSNPIIVVAIEFDELAPILIDSGVRLATALHGNLHLIHIVTPSFAELTAYPVGLGMDYVDTIKSIDEQKMIEAENKLRDLSKGVPASLVTTRKVMLSPFISEGVLSEAQSKEATLVMCGVHTQEELKVPRGFSTVLELMNAASIPVIVLRKDIELKITSDSCHFLVADDFRDSGYGALHFAIKLARLFSHATIDHVHVQPLNHDEFRTTVDNFLKSRHVLALETVSADELIASITKQITRTMEERAAVIKSLAMNAGIDYRTQLLSGDPAEEIAKHAQAAEADVIIFGHHAKLHHKPLSTGKIPLRMMLQSPRPVIVTPSLA